MGVGRAPKKKVKYVVVVGADRKSLGTPFGKFGIEADWSCFVGEDKAEVLERALQARAGWGTRDYQLWVGTLTEKVIIPNNWKLVTL